MKPYEFLLAMSIPTVATASIIISIGFLVGWCLRNALVQSVKTSDHQALYNEYVSLFQQHQNYIKQQEELLSNLKAENTQLKSQHGGKLKRVV